jgi:predicted SnoaL-like aldol condensation-catalyzing enzyme
MPEVRMNQSPAKTTPKEAAMDFLRLVATGQVREAYSKYIGPEFRHHNAYFRGDADSLMLAMEENAVKNPNKVLQILRALQEGDLVAVHSRVKQNAADRGAALVHIFRFQGDRVAELWDIAQPVPEHSPNEHGMF